LKEVSNMSGKHWTKLETKALIMLYPKFTTRELKVIFPSKTQESISSKIRRLKKQGLITSNRDRETQIRAMFV
jgi:hypothetical protein